MCAKFIITLGINTPHLRLFTFDACSLVSCNCCRYRKTKIIKNETNNYFKSGQDFNCVQRWKQWFPILGKIEWVFLEGDTLPLKEYTDFEGYFKTRQFGVFAAQGYSCHHVTWVTMTLMDKPWQKPDFVRKLCKSVVSIWAVQRCGGRGSCRSWGLDVGRYGLSCGASWKPQRCLRRRLCASAFNYSCCNAATSRLWTIGTRLWTARISVKSHWLKVDISFSGYHCIWPDF